MDYQSLCEDCDRPTTPEPITAGAWEWYMVTDKVWAEAGMTTGFLCIGCLEIRLGRQLEPADFKPLPINQPAYFMSSRLIGRLARGSFSMR